MAAKKFDLGAYSSDTGKTQAKHKKYSAFIENETEDAPAPEKAEKAKKQSPILPTISYPQSLYPMKISRKTEHRKE